MLRAIVLSVVLAAGVGVGAEPTREIIEKHRDPKIRVYGDYSLVKLPIKTGVKLWNPTAIAKDSKGRMWAANYVGEIYSLHDKDGDGLEDHAELFCNVKDDKLYYPTTILWLGDELLVGTPKEIRAYKDTDGDFKADESRVFFNDFPCGGHLFDWTFALELGPDGKVYLIFCTDYLGPNPPPDPKGYRGAIVTLSKDGTNPEIYATGLRYAYGMALTEEGDVFFTDNNGGGNPTEEINFAEKGKFYGHNTKKYGELPAVQSLVKIKNGFGSGGLEYNSKKNDFAGTAGNLFMACWGPDGRWDRGSLLRFELSKKADGGYDAKEIFVTSEFPKIIDLKFADNGDLYIAQFGKEGPSHRPADKPYGAIYRMMATDWAKADVPLAKLPFVKGDKEKGKALFDARCGACHLAERNKKKMLGPNLAEIGKMFDRKEILRDIKDPSAGIKTDYEQYHVTKKDGTTYIGRKLWARRGEVRLVTAGNQVVHLKRGETASQKMVEGSMMPPDLLEGLSEQDINDLLAYLKVRESE